MFASRCLAFLFYLSYQNLSDKSNDWNVVTNFRNFYEHKVSNISGALVDFSNFFTSRYSVGAVLGSWFEVMGIEMQTLSDCFHLIAQQCCLQSYGCRHRLRPLLVYSPHHERLCCVVIIVSPPGRYLLTTHTNQPGAIFVPIYRPSFTDLVTTLIQHFPFFQPFCYYFIQSIRSFHMVSHSFTHNNFLRLHSF